MCLCRGIVAIVLLFTSAYAVGAAEFPYAADVNGDAAVNIIDMIRARNLIGCSSGTPGAFWADVNSDGQVNILDLIAVRNHLGSRLPQQEFVFDFGTPTSPVAPGAIPVLTTTDYDPSLGYGWYAPPDRSYLWAEDRDWEDPLGRDMIAGDTLTTFRVDLPNDSYEVAIVGAWVDGLTIMRFGLKGGEVVGMLYTNGSLGGTIDYIMPTPEVNVRRFLDIAVDQDHIEINFAGRDSALWSVASVTIQKDAADLILHDVHLDVDRSYDFSPPTRDSNLDFVSQTFADYQQDWDFLTNWYQDVIDDGMTDGEKVQAVIQKIWDTLQNAGTWGVHPVDVLISGRGVCVHRSEAFQYLMHTLGLPSRGAGLWVIQDARYGDETIAKDPLAHTVALHNVAQVHYDGKWHTYDTTFGALYDCSIVELVCDPTILPVMYQEERIRDPFFWTQVKEIHFFMDMNQWRYAGSSTEIVRYTPQTARTIYGNTLPSFPFKLQSRRPGFAADDRVLPIRRFYGYNSPPLDLEPGHVIRYEVHISPLEGIDRLSNQLNVRWFPAPGAGQLRLMLTVNGSQRSVTMPIKSETVDNVPIILEVPAEDLREGTNTIDISLLTPGTLQIIRAYYREDEGLAFPPPQRALPGDPSGFQPLEYHLFWNIDLVYKMNSRTSPGQIAFDFSHMPGVAKSVLLLPHIEPLEILGSNGFPAIFPFSNYRFDGTSLLMEQVPTFIRVKQ